MKRHGIPLGRVGARRGRVAAYAVARVRIAGGTKCASAPRVVCALQCGRKSRAVRRSRSAPGKPSRAPCREGPDAVDAVAQCTRIVRARSKLPRVRTTATTSMDRPRSLSAFQRPRCTLLSGAERRGGLVARIDVDEHGALGFQRDRQLERAIAACVSGRPLRRPSGHRAPGRTRARESGTRGRYG